VTAGAPTDAPAGDAAAEPTKRSGAFGTIVKWGLLVAGVVAVALLVRDAGPARVGRVLLEAGPFVPVVVLLEACWTATDTLALRSLLARLGAHAPKRAYVRSAMMGYATMVFLPAGRAGAEIVRATELAKHVGGTRVAACATLTQGVALLANAAITLPCAAAIASVVGVHHELTWLCLGNAALCGALGAAFVVIPRRAGLGSALGRLLKKAFSRGPEYDAALRELPAAPLQAIALVTAGRAIQTFQYGVVLAAVGGALTPRGALVSQGIHLVGAAAGDFVPSQAGVLEGAYRFFGGVLGVDPARAVSIALLVRLAQFLLATLGLVAAPLASSPAPARETPAPTA